MIRFVYPNASNGIFFGCGRLALFGHNEDLPSGVKYCTTNTILCTTSEIHKTRSFFAPKVGAKGFKILIEKDQESGTYKGDSQHLAHLLTQIKSAYLTSWGDDENYAIDIWCTGELKTINGNPALYQVEDFDIKLRHFLKENSNGIFIVPLANMAPINETDFIGISNYIIVDSEKLIASQLINRHVNLIITVAPTYDALKYLINRLFPGTTTTSDSSDNELNGHNAEDNRAINANRKSFIVPGSSYDLISGIASTKNNLNGCDPSWFPPGDGTVILGAGAIDPATSESRTSATWKIKIDFDSVKHFQKGYLVIACQRLFGGLHSAKRGVGVTVKLNDNYVDGFSLLDIPPGHSDYFHRMRNKVSLPSSFPECETVYAWPIQKIALLTEGSQTVSVSIDKEASWDIDYVGIVCISERNKRRKIILAAIIVFILSLLSLGIFYLKSDKIVVSSHLESIYQSGANFYVDVTNNCFHDVYIKSVMLNFDLNKASILNASNDPSKPFKIDGESHQLSCEDSNVDKEPLHPAQQRQYKTKFTIDQIGRFLKEGFSKPTVNVYSNRGLLASTQSPLLGKELMMHYSSEAKLSRSALPTAAFTVNDSKISDINQNLQSKQQNSYDVKKKVLIKQVPAKPKSAPNIINNAIEIETEPKWINTK